LIRKPQITENPFAPIGSAGKEDIDNNSEKNENQNQNKDENI